MDCPEGHRCANEPIHAQAKIIKQRMEIKRLTEQLRVATQALDFIVENDRQLPSAPVIAEDALTQMSVME